MIFTGRLDRRVVPSVLSVSDACLVHLRASPTFTAVMPSKVVEAAAMARPIILGVSGFARLWIEKAGCGLYVEPEDEGALVAAALRLAGDAGLRQRLGSAGRKFVLRELDRGRLAARYLEIIQSTASRAETEGTGQ